VSNHAGIPITGPNATDAPQTIAALAQVGGAVPSTVSVFVGDNRTIAVTINATSQPIAQASSSQVSQALAQGAQPVTLSIALTNLGQGTLTSKRVSSTGQGFTAAAIPGAAVTFDPGRPAVMPPARRL
jgi:hypothetical protein